ncbi:NUDIX domain-containing protein [Yoonia sediminilitoris]|uniref:8-oxo-dGTP diphosphatase n=1 Tax=Yoonia sediminilitoris TaxID=1286148 RepID=A0A2T6KLS2_9RHOB|nr:NUDIX hydrolase [Yoonia sediminilitoris]PUB17159.1 8-oxo-dGTP diphosphatase [Yoonia sediminilitoris]RCW97454.1 8-oxo-dGTP diphosphatase [Yoonia sediminilitoris]
MIRRYGSAPLAGQQYEVRHGAYGVLRRSGQVLLTWQGGEHNELQLPGGGIDPGESPLRALHREVYEETGWSIARPRRLGVFRRFTFMPEYDKWAEKVCHIFIAHPVRRLDEAPEPDHTPVWMDLAEAIPLLHNDGDAHFVAVAGRG